VAGQSSNSLVLETRRSSLVSIAGLTAAVATGTALGAGYTLGALLILVAVAATLTPALTLTQWCILLLVTSVAGRGLVALLGLPTLVGFLHYPVTVAFAAYATHRPGTPVSRRIGRWLTGLLALLILSMLANGSHPLRAALYLAISGEPLLVLWAVVRWGPHIHVERKVGLGALALLALQIPLGVWQGMKFGWMDPVQGTVVGSGAGAHILGGLFALGLLVVVGAAMDGRVPWPVSLAAGTVAVGMMIAAGANQVVIAVAMAISVLPLIAWSPSHSRSRRRLLLGGAVLSVVLALTALMIMQRANESDIIGRAEGLSRPDQLPETRLTLERFSKHPLQLVFGDGPGTTASRASILLTPEMLRQSSPLAALRLSPTEEAVRIVSQVRAHYGGSAESVASGTFGIVGDLGLLGLVGLALILAGVWREAGRSRNQLARAARGALLMSAILSFIDNWLEYPEYAVPLALLLAFALQERLPGRDQ
jgi:hypothetical protein